MSAELSDNAQVRLAAFVFLDSLKAQHGDALPRELLLKGFEFRGERVPLIGPQGIFKPRLLTDAPLSITTAPIEEGKDRPYEDSVGSDGVISYRYRGTDPMHYENVGLRRAMTERIPLVYFVGLVPGRYAAEFPAFVVGDDPTTLTFSVAIDEAVAPFRAGPTIAEPLIATRRAYVTTVAQRRVHQQAFRERVLVAYEQCCAVCRLKHRPLLDAAHIIPDGHPKGDPVVSNGLALCKIHHAAFDHNILGIREDLVIHIRKDVLEEHDGPMLKHGLQELHGTRLVVIPHSRAHRPSVEHLAWRFAEFSRAG